jgi:hypothetical protein
VTSERRALSSVGPAADVDKVVTVILLVQDGATLGAQGHRYTGDGIMVAMPEHGAVIDTAHTPGWMDALAQWVERVAPVVTEVGATPARYFGAWYGPNGHLYLDVVQGFSSADRDLAIAAGRARDQIAVWDAARREEIPTGGKGGLQA